MRKKLILISDYFAHRRQLLSFGINDGDLPEDIFDELYDMDCIRLQLSVSKISARVKIEAMKLAGFNDNEELLKTNKTT